MKRGESGLDNDKNIIISDFVRRFGNGTSIGLFHPLCKVLKDPSIDGMIGYRVERNCAVAYGDPLCEKNDRLALTQLFHDTCREQKKSIIYLMTSESFAHDMVTIFVGASFQVGHEMIIDVKNDPLTARGTYASQLRQKHRHVLARGVSVVEYLGSDLTIEHILITIAKNWLHNRKGPQAFIIPLDVFAFRSTKRWFYAQQDDQIVGFLMLNKIDGGEGWVLNPGIILAPNAPNHTSEFLMLHVLSVMRDEDVKYFTTGPIMSSNSNDQNNIEGFGWFSKLLIQSGMNSTRKIFNLTDRQRFWSKFQPHKEPSFVAFGSSRIGVKEIRAILRALNVSI